MELEGYADLKKAFDRYKKGDLIAANIDMIKKAHADGEYSLQEIIANQQKYQNWLIHELKGNTKVIMNCHRSIGFEFEFATYQAEKTFLSHVLISKSKPFSNLFKLPFMLETDIYNELEIGMPPFLISTLDNRIRKDAIYRIWMRMKKAMSLINIEMQGKKVEDLIATLQSQKLGDFWTGNLTGEHISIAKRKKHWEKQDQIYSQLNISLKASEIASFIEKHGIRSYKSERYEYFKETYSKLFNLFLKDLKNQQEKIAVIHLCKGLSHLLAIPSLLLLKESPESMQNDRGVYSSVKEIFGVWVKDSVVNLVDSSAKDSEARIQIGLLIQQQKPNIDLIMKEQIAKAIRIIKSLTNAHEDYEYSAYAEYEVTLKNILKRLKLSKPSLKAIKHTEEYRKESFPSNGEGVRKETYTSLYTDEHEYYHLTEFRNDMQIMFFLNESE